MAREGFFIWLFTDYLLTEINTDNLLILLEMNGRGGRIRTYGLLLPRQAR